MTLKRQVVVRRTVVCEACGASVGLNETICPYCRSEFEPLEIENDPNRLPSANHFVYTKQDSELIKPFIDSLLEFSYYRPIEVDELYNAIKVLRDRNYPFRNYILELLSDTRHFRSVCLERSDEKRRVHLEILKKLEAIYTSLTT